MSTKKKKMHYDAFLRIAGRYLERLNEEGCPLFLAKERDFWIKLALWEFMHENCV